MTISLRTAIEADKPFLSRLEEVCMREYVVALWGAWRPRPDDKLVLEGHRIVVEHQDDIGCIATALRPDHIWLDKLYLLPSAQRRGVGGEIMRMLISDAEAASLPIKLSVLVTNPALVFYLRHGFKLYEETSERRFLAL
jgi:GNAT superfamily N-acetyltransferase